VIRSFASGVARTVFFGNHFYGLCALALAVEASVQQQTPLPDAGFFILLYLSVVVYYNQAYLFTESDAKAPNVRTAWYARNRNRLHLLQRFYILTLMFTGICVIYAHLNGLLNMKPYEWLLLIVFPLVSAAYYGFSPERKQFTLRNVGWLKPFIIGFSWAGLATMYPIIYSSMSAGTHYEPGLVACFLFIKNMMFVAVLCIMFDIKDYAMDYNFRIKTFVVNLGLRKTIFYVIIPLCVAGLVSFVSYGLWRGFHPMKIALNVVPFVAAVAVAYSLHLRRSIFYYLVVIDGLMFLKAICGITAMIYFQP
jgi:hypothetical protein